MSILEKFFPSILKKAASAGAERNVFLSPEDGILPIISTIISNNCKLGQLVFTLFTVTFASNEEAPALLKRKATFLNQNNSLLASWILQGLLSGTIPSATENLTNLVYDLSANKFSGKIPPQIGSVTKLETLYIFDNHLNGSIPGESANVKNLAQ
ncbi:hypothetical protein HAX54_030218 [Datura stramonium]|uniref:Uncharacterized protein n=1 Tax=Datura stramonium TaxID=4076 RepID=A0ABS8SAU6_DATST|nr:hypothetical protein [Datura stramonium]